MSASNQAVASMLNAYRAAVHDKDVDAFMALYAQDVRVFDMWGAWHCDGADALRAIVVGWFGSLGTERVVIRVDEVQGHESGDLAAGHGFLTFSAVSPEGVELRSMNNRISLVLERSGPSWKIVHQHTSAPVDMGSMKVNLQRERVAS